MADIFGDQTLGYLSRKPFLLVALVYAAAVIIATLVLWRSVSSAQNPPVCQWRFLVDRLPATMPEHLQAMAGTWGNPSSPRIPTV